MEFNISKEQKAEIAALDEQIAAAREDFGKYEAQVIEKSKKLNDSNYVDELARQIKEALIAIDDDQPGAREKLAELKAERTVLDDLPALIDGYEQKAAAANAKAKSAEHQKNKIIASVLLAEADKLGGEYLAAAQIVAEKFRELMAISTLLSQPGHGQGFCPAGVHAAFNIPVFSLPSHAGQQSPPGGSDWRIAKDIQANAGGLLAADADQAERALEMAISS